VQAGQVTTYGTIAAAMQLDGLGGNDKKKTTTKGSSARAVGNALRHNPYAPHVPCHRVVPSTWKIGGFSGATALKSALVGKKMRLLRSEGVAVVAGKLVNPHGAFVDLAQQAAAAAKQQAPPLLTEAHLSDKALRGY
jgi:O-6-methylguanine DNA methyltransferase